MNPMEKQSALKGGDVEKVVTLPVGVQQGSEDDDTDDDEVNWEGRVVGQQRRPQPPSVTVWKGLPWNGPPPVDWLTETKGGGSLAKPTVVVRPKPYVPQSNPARRRERSLEAVHEAKRLIEETTGQSHRLVRETTTGMLLPRDQVIDIRPPSMKVDEKGRQVVLPSVAEDLNEGQDTIASKVAGPNEVIHYKRSVDIVSDLREARLLRLLS